MDYLFRQHQGVAALKRLLEAGQFVNDAAQTPDVGLVIVRLVLHDLRTSVDQRAHKGVHQLRRVLQVLGEPEVHQLDAVVLVDHDVRRVQVSVHDPLVDVQVLQRRANASIITAI